MTARLRIIFFILLLAIPAACLALWPKLDLTASGLFYRADEGFYLSDHPVFIVLHIIATKGAWALAIILIAFTAYTIITHKNIFALDAKSWTFLTLALLIGPVLIANMGLKDHWGRARPREVTEFGGTATFSPALIPQSHGHKNSSFIAGDAAFGFYLPSLAYVGGGSSPVKRRRLFWLGIGTGALFGFVRLAMGAHFLSDILFAALLMLAVSAILHAIMFGWKTTSNCWQGWFSKDNLG